VFVRKKDLKRSSTISSLENDGNVGIPKLLGEDSHNQAPGDSGRKSTPKGSGDRNPNPSPSALVDEFDATAGNGVFSRWRNDNFILKFESVLSR